jgi:hypothetical protein
MVTVREGCDKDKIAALGFNLVKPKRRGDPLVNRMHPTKKLQWRDKMQTKPDIALEQGRAMRHLI